MGLHCNESKTEFIYTTPNCHLRSPAGAMITKVDDFKYLGSYIMDSQKDVKSRKALAWAACNKLNKIWHSNLVNEQKIYLFNVLIEPILLYGSETWTLTTHQQQRLDGTYTNLLRRAQNIHWSEHATREHIYDNLPPLSQTLAKRRLQFAGHCQRAMGKIVQSLLLWKPVLSTPEDWPFLMWQPGTRG